MGKSFSATMGKGGDFESAAVGAMMEAIEVFCAEELPQPIIQGSIPPAQSQTDGKATSCAGMAGACGMWLDATDLISGNPAKIPFYAVSLDYTRQDDFPMANSNGLASGSTITEALRAAISELIERDRMANWMCCTPDRKADARVNLETVENLDCQAVFLKIQDAGCKLLLWDVSKVDCLPVFVAAILDKYDYCNTLYPAFGAAARLDPAAAVIAAVREAAQTRAALIVGTRDDFGMECYKAPRKTHGRILLETFAFVPASRAFAEMPVASCPDAEGEVAWLIDNLAARGVGQLLWTDLSRKDLGIPVAKVMASSLKDYNANLTAWRRRQ